MNRLIEMADWLGREWIRFLVWFVTGLFVLPIVTSVVTGWVNLDRFYDGLVPGNLELGVVLLVLAPYLLYLGYRLKHHASDGGGYYQEDGHSGEAHG